MVSLLAGMGLAACSSGGSINGSRPSRPNTKTTVAMPDSTSTAQTETTVSRPATTIVSTTSSSADVAPDTGTTIDEANITIEQVSANPGLRSCLPYFRVSQYTNHEFEVCPAYILNAQQFALRTEYKFGNNTATYLSDFAQHSLRNRYWGESRTGVENEVGAWQKTKKLLGNNVDASVTVVSLTANLEADRALLSTRESWKVTAPDGKVLLDEPNKDIGVTMCRGQLPGHPRHAWVVVKPVQDPAFDCIRFDNENGLKS